MDDIELLRKLPGCPKHQQAPVPCPDHRGGCLVAHYAPGYAVQSARHCDDCAEKLLDALKEHYDAIRKEVHE